MNNEQFRKLVQSTPRQPASASSPANSTNRNGATPSAALGSRARSSIPMTPRTVAGYSSSNDFARQLAERNAALSQTSTTKKFRSSAAPKGAKLPSGYVDRSKALRSQDEDAEEGSDKVQRVKALEEMMKLGQMDEQTFVALREEILGESVNERASVVKGLDWELLRRVKRGEVDVSDVLDEKKQQAQGEGEAQSDEDVDDEFEELEEKEVEAVVKEKAKKKGEMAPSSLTGKKRTRDQLLAEMKAARLAAKEAAQPSLGSKFKKVGEKRSESRIERDGKGREVLITIDEHGNEKRKVRKVQVSEVPQENGHGLLMPDKDAKPLGMEVPAIPVAAPESDDDGDIFDDVGDDYDPLAGLADEDSDAEMEETEDGEISGEDASKEKANGKPDDIPKNNMPPPPLPSKPPAQRNYFGTTISSSTTTSETQRPAALTDPTLLAAIKKASSLNPLASTSHLTEEEAAKEARRKKMLQRDDRDEQDMDMGFGSSRFEDEADAEEKKIKLSKWGAEDDDDGDGDGKGGKGGGKRKRGGKKRKGDGDSAKDVLAVLERRKGEKK